MEIVKRLESEGLEVNKEDSYYVIEDVEGHIVTMDIEGDKVEIMGNEGDKDFHNINQEHMIVYSVLSALDYEFE